ncbi:MAG TPA: sodium/sugar symporter [Cyclobacteriaceae bacterium]|nr:sodium/sugar symporter [Cyclobacteriaceae bacterium]
MPGLVAKDYAVFLLYFLVVGSYGIYIYFRKKKATTDSKDFFLAEGSLTWWAIGASLIASNISAEHFIGMSGSGFALGLAISTYEWMAAATLIIVAVVFIPYYLKNKIYTMPQFLAIRYNDGVATTMAVFWLFVYVLVNLTSILYLGALAISAISGFPFVYCIRGLVLFAIILTIGGMKVIGYTDVIQVAVLIFGGLVTTWLALNLLSDRMGTGEGIFEGLSLLKTKADSHFHMIFDKGHPYYMDLPGLSVLVGGMWINNLNYWGCNQYIIQRALGADLKTARNGILFAAFLKLLIPVIAVLPGIAMFVMYQEGMFSSEMADSMGNVRPDHAYPTLMNLLAPGLKGLAFAALTAAIVASLAGKANSIATIFSLDIYKKFIDKKASERKQVIAGRIVIIVTLVFAGRLAPKLAALDQAYQFIQEYVGFISPGVLAIFLMGFFWKRTTSMAALAGTLLTIPVSAILKFLPAWTDGAFPDYPFLDRMTITFLFIIVVMVIISLMKPATNEPSKLFPLDRSMLSVSPAFKVGSVVIVVILIVLYAVFW